MKRISSALILLFMSIAAWPQNPPSTPVPADFFGMHLGFPIDWPSVSVGAVGKGAAVGWPYIEQPSKGHYSWARLDAYVQLAKDHGVRYLQNLGGCPCWAAPLAMQSNCTTLYNGQKAYAGMVNNLQDWDDFNAAMVTHLKNKFPGVVDYELWNEPDQSFAGTTAELVTLTTHAYKTVRTIDPTAKIVAPSYVRSSNLDAYYAAGGIRTIDVNSLHGYPNPSNDVAETIGGFLSLPFKAVYAKYGIQTKPIWDTEGSWGQESTGAITDPNLQAAFVARYYLLHWSNGITRLNWYTWEDNPGGWGFLRNASTQIARPAAIAYQEVYNWMVGATMPSPGCTIISGTGYSAAWTCPITRPGGYKAFAIWNAAGSSSYTPPSGYTQYRDLNGRVSRITGPITIGLQPILLEFSQSPPAPAGLAAIVN